MLKIARSRIFGFFSVVLAVALGTALNGCGGGLATPNTDESVDGGGRVAIAVSLETMGLANLAQSSRGGGDPLVLRTVLGRPDNGDLPGTAPFIDGVATVTYENLRSGVWTLRVCTISQGEDVLFANSDQPSGDVQPGGVVNLTPLLVPPPPGDLTVTPRLRLTPAAGTMIDMIMPSPVWEFQAYDVRGPVSIDFRMIASAHPEWGYAAGEIEIVNTELSGIEQPANYEADKVHLRSYNVGGEEVVYGMVVEPNVGVRFRVSLYSVYSTGHPAEEYDQMKVELWEHDDDVPPDNLLEDNTYYLQH